VLQQTSLFALTSCSSVGRFVLFVKVCCFDGDVKVSHRRPLIRASIKIRTRASLRLNLKVMKQHLLEGDKYLVCF